MIKQKALFLDRDGVINLDIGYAHLPEHIQFVPGIFNFCARFQAADFLLIVITNQSGIGRGYFNQDQFHQLCKWMRDQFELRNLELLKTYHCPHHPQAAMADYLQDCECRKPKPGLILQAIKDYNIDPGRSIMIGDKCKDMQAAQTAGVAGRILFGDHDRSPEATHRLENFSNLESIHSLLC